MNEEFIRVAQEQVSQQNLETNAKIILKPPLN